MSLRSLEDYMGNVLTGATATVEKATVMQVRALRPQKKARGAPVFLAALVLLSLLTLSAIALALYKPDLWNRLSGEFKTVAGVAYRTARQAIAATREEGRPAFPANQPERRKAKDFPSFAKGQFDDSGFLSKRGKATAGDAMAAFQRPQPGARPGNDSGAALTLGPLAAAGMVRVQVTPLTASVKVDNRALTAQEMAGTVLAGGVHQFLATADGFAPSSTSVTVSGNDTHLVIIGLVKENKTGELDVLSDIAAELYIDGEFKGNAPTSSPLVLSEGEHTVVFKRPGFKPYEKTVTIRPGEIRQIKVESGTRSAGK